MEKNQIVLLEDRGLISISGEDSKDFLQNIVTNDVNKVSFSNTVFSGLLTPQGKYLFDFFLIKSKDGYLLDCDNKVTSEVISYLSKYKLRSNVKIENLSTEYVVGVLNLEKLNEIQKNGNENKDTINYREGFLFVDPRKKGLGARILLTLKDLHLTIKKLNLKIVNSENYYIKTHSLGVPVKGVENLKEQLFGLEANLEDLKAIDFKKGCYIGQENTARMKLKNKLRRKLLPIKSTEVLKIGSEVKYNNITIGKVLINKPYPFALIKLFDPNYSEFKNENLQVDQFQIKIINY